MGADNREWAMGQGFHASDPVTGWTETQGGGICSSVAHSPSAAPQLLAGFWHHGAQTEAMSHTELQSHPLQQRKICNKPQEPDGLFVWESGMNKSVEYQSCDTAVHGGPLRAATTPQNCSVRPRARLLVRAVTVPGEIAVNISEGRAVKHWDACNVTGTY